MADIQIHFFGWARDEEKNNDKIWGWVNVEGKLYNFWGRRAKSEDEKKTLTFKRNPGNWSGNRALHALADKKQHPSGGKTPYRSIPCERAEDGTWPSIEAVYPGFSKQFGKQLMYARLTDQAGSNF